MHLRIVFDEGELDREATRKDFLQVRQEGSRAVRRDVGQWNLDTVLSVGRRTKRRVATRVRFGQPWLHHFAGFPDGLWNRWVDMNTWIDISPE